MSCSIRAATREDADGIADAHVAAWRAGYAHVFPKSVLYAEDFDSSRRAFWRAWSFLPGHGIVVATKSATTGDPIIGFASFGPERERGGGQTDRGELWACYVHPDEWGSGVADGLIAHAQEQLRDAGFTTAMLWVVDDNPRARRFYERHGWSATGRSASFDRYCEAKVPEVEYERELS